MFISVPKKTAPPLLQPAEKFNLLEKKTDLVSSPSPLSIQKRHDQFPDVMTHFLTS